MSNGAGELRNSLLGGQLPKSFQLLNDSYDEREVFRNIILSVQVVVRLHLILKQVTTFMYLHRGLIVKEVCQRPKKGEGGFFVNSK